jgi:hypothetical protein
MNRNSSFASFHTYYLSIVFVLAMLKVSLNIFEKKPGLTTTVFQAI